MAHPDDKVCYLTDKNGGRIPGVCVPYYLCSGTSIITDGRGLFNIKAKSGQSYRIQIGTTCDVESEKPALPIIEKRIGCGFRNVDGIGFQLNDDSDIRKTGFGEFPWTAAIFKDISLAGEQEQLKFQCTGSLIHPSVVLTVANGVQGFDLSELKVRLGEWDTSSR